MANLPGRRRNAVASAISAVILCLAVPAWAAGELHDFAGTYAVAGENPGGAGSYQGQATIVRNGETYRVEWTVGADIFIGTGIGYETLLSVGYDGGIAVYQAMEDGALYGVWAPSDGPALGAEILTPILGK